MPDRPTEERHKLLDDELLARLDPSNPWRTRGPSIFSVSQRILAGRRSLERPNWAGVHFNDVILRATRFEGGSMRQLRFEGGRLDGVVMRGTHLKKVVFVGVTLSNLKLLGVRLEQCLFKLCKLENHYWDEASFEDCAFEDCDMTSVQISSASLQRSVFQNCRGRLFQWSESSLDSVAWLGGGLQRSRWTLCRAGQVRIEGAKLDQVTLLGGDYASLTFREVDAASVSLSNLELGTVLFSTSPRLVDTRVVACRGKNLAVMGSSQVLGLSLMLSQFERFAVTRSTVDQLELDDSRVSAGMELIETRMQGLSLVESSVNGFGLETVRFGGYITVQRSQISGMRGRRLSTESGLECNLSEVTYTDCPLTFEDIHAS